MKDKTWYEETKEELIRNINNKHTLDLALKILEERQSLLNGSLKKEEIINKAIEYISNKKVIINTDVIRIFDLFEIDEQGYTDKLLDILKEVSE